MIPSLCPKATDFQANSGQQTAESSLLLVDSK